ncbi:10688_t:CDS:2 [Entrophospora sp. SA101]|nr:10688_t:CDS:2 [Entrophospora sp. SA101]
MQLVAQFIKDLCTYTLTLQENLTQVLDATHFLTNLEEIEDGVLLSDDESDDVSPQHIRIFVGEELRRVLQFGVYVNISDQIFADSFLNLEENDNGNENVGNYIEIQILM